MGFWTGLKRALFGWERYENLNDFIFNVKTIDEAYDYAKQHFVYEPDKSPKDEWQLPPLAFKSLQTKNSAGDCDDYATVFGAFCSAKGIPYHLLAIWRKGEGHAVCVAEKDNRYLILDNFFRGLWRYASMQDVCREVYSDYTEARYVDFDPKLNKYVIGRKV